jgi:tetratricopeptide (TPR) repeat protein
VIFDKQGEARSLSNLANAYTSIGHYQKAISLYQQSLRISQLIDDKHGEANSLTNLAATYFQIGRFKKAFFALNRANQILQELQLPLNLESYIEWLILFIRFAQRGKWQIALCFCIGLFAFPLFIAHLVALLLWRLIKEKVGSKNWS